MKYNILVVDDDSGIRYTFSYFLSKEGYNVMTAGNYNEAVEKISEINFDLIFSDIILEEKSGMDLLKFIKDKNLTCPVIIITGYPSFDTVSQSIRLGAFDYILKPLDKKTILDVTKIALNFKMVIDENNRYRLNLEAIFRSIEEGIITVDKDLNIIQLNEAAKNINGFLDNPIGKPFENLIKGCNGYVCYETLKKSITTKQTVKIYRHECHRKTRMNQIVTVIVNPMIDEKNEISGAVMVIRDETNLVNFEQKVAERQRFCNIIGKNEKMQKIYSLLEKLADCSSTVFITGETGTGKELAAEALHYKGNRCNNPFVKINCSALPENLLESELFGYVKGAFTGAIKDKLGLFQKAHGGTIFLDEIGDISPALQLRLLRVIQEMEFIRIGDTVPVKVDVRVIVATNQNLQEKIEKKEFREDLYYRINVIEINLPPLRDRNEDIPVLVTYFIEKLNKKFNKHISFISKDVLKIFMDYNWPGNIRELEHAIEHAFILTDNPIITTEDLPQKFKNLIPSTLKSKGMGMDKEVILILETLQKTDWNKAKTARLLGIERKTLYNKIAKYKIASE